MKKRCSTSTTALEDESLELQIKALQGTLHVSFISDRTSGSHKICIRSCHPRGAGGAGSASYTSTIIIRALEKTQKCNFYDCAPFLACQNSSFPRFPIWLEASVVVSLQRVLSRLRLRNAHKPDHHQRSQRPQPLLLWQAVRNRWKLRQKRNHHRTPSPRFSALRLAR